jgi:hypothetical protein
VKILYNIRKDSLAGKPFEVGELEQIHFESGQGEGRCEGMATISSTQSRYQIFPVEKPSLSPFQDVI